MDCPTTTIMQTEVSRYNVNNIDVEALSPSKLQMTYIAIIAAKLEDKILNYYLLQIFITNQLCVTKLLF